MYIFVQSYILFLNYQIKTVKNCMGNTEKVYYPCRFQLIQGYKQRVPCVIMIHGTHLCY